jgi:hypothetical protein
MTRCGRASVRELDVVASTLGSWAKCEAGVVCGTDENANGDVGAARGMGEDVGAMCGMS